MDKLLEWERPVQVVQLVAVGASAVASCLYLHRWYTINFKIINEYSFLDYKYPQPDLTELQTLAAVGGERVSDVMKTIIASEEGQFIGAWSSDVFRVDSIISKMLRECECRVIELDFSNIVWAESLSAWMTRLYHTSNPVRTVLKEMISLIRDDIVSGASHMGDADVSPTEMTALMVEMRILLAEKREQCMNAQKKQPDRPLVVSIKGIDKLIATEKRFGAKGRRVIIEYLNHFLSFIGTSKLHVVVSMSDQFFLRFWLHHPPLRAHGLCLHVPPASLREIQCAWGSRAQASLTQQSKRKRGGMVETNEVASVADADALLRDIVDVYGPVAGDISRSLVSVCSGLAPSVAALAQTDLRIVIMAWVQSFASLLTRATDDQVVGRALDRSDSDDEDTSAFSAVRCSVSEQMGKLQLRIFELLARAPRGEVSFHSLLQLPGGNNLLEHALGDMIDSPDSLLTVHMMEKGEVGDGGIRHSLVGGGDGQTQRTLAGGSSSSGLGLNIADLASCGLYVMPRRPLLLQGMQHISTLVEDSTN